MNSLSLEEALRLSEERFFQAIDKALEKLTEKEIAQTIGTSTPSVRCWARHTRAPHPAIRRRVLQEINKLLDAKVDSP